MFVGANRSEEGGIPGAGDVDGQELPCVDAGN